MEKDCRWIDVNDKLPFDEYSDSDFYVMDKVLVTVQTKEYDPNEKPEVMMLWFNAETKQFTIGLIGDEPYEKNHDWYVSHWMKKPKPAQRKEGRR